MNKLIRQAFLAPTDETRLNLRRGALIAGSKDRCAEATESLEKDLEECVKYLRLPSKHHVGIRTTNHLERLNAEGRRRTKVIARFPSECECEPALR